jgi:hypothetical protein
VVLHLYFQERVSVEAAIFGFIGALIGSVLGFIGSLLSTFGKSRDTSKDVLTRTVTTERSQWRKDLREIASEFVENALRIVANDPGGSIYNLERQRVLIRVRLNPKPEHVLDASILREIANVVKQARALDSESLAVSLENFERDVQFLLKQEWDKSKDEAVSGMLERRTDKQ